MNSTHLLWHVNIKDIPVNYPSHALLHRLNKENHKRSQQTQEIACNITKITMAEKVDEVRNSLLV